MKKIVFAAGVALLAAGCATLGRNFDSGITARIQDGVTTQADLRSMLGEPDRVGVDDGDVTWTYLYSKVGVFRKYQEEKDLYLRFDAAGKVKSYSFNSTFLADKARLAK
jgi:outer membrane protein assembly factor BamE (lipoprotein component of BamABCDE complex)